MSKIHYGLGSVTATNWSVYAPGSVYTPNLPMVTPRVDYRGLRPLRIDSWGASASGDYWVQCVYNGSAISGGSVYSTYPSSVYLIRVYANSGTVTPGRQTGSGYRMYWDSDGDSVDGGIVSWIYYTEAPSAPTLVSVTPQNGTEAVVVFAAPADGGGDPVNASTGYTIQYATNSNFNTGVGQVTVVGAGSHTVTGLTAGQTYFWRVMMRNGLTNALGTLGGAASGTLSALQGQEPQGAPGLSVVSSLSGASANYSLTPPSNTGGAPITGYDLEYRLIGGASTQFFSASASGSRSGLAQGQTYEWRARARNVVGAGPWSSWIQVTQNQTSLDVGGYFDGASEDVSDTSFSWDGTANGSTSSAEGLGVLGWLDFDEGNADSGGTGVVAQVNNGIFGPKAARVVWKSDATAPGFIAGPRANATDGAAVEAGTTYFGSIYVRPSRVARMAAVMVWSDAVGAEVGRSIGTYQVVGQGQAARLLVTAVAPAGAEYGAPVVIDGSEVVATNSYLYPSFELPSGTVTARENLFPTPLISASLAGFVLRSEVSDAGAVTGGRAFTITGAVSSFGYLVRANDHAALAVSPGDIRSGAVKVKNTSAVAISLRLELRTYTATTAQTAVNDGPTVAIQPGATATLTSEGAVVPATSTKMRPTIASVLPLASGETFEVLDDWILEAGATVGSLFSGSTPAAGGFEYAWSGAENDSTSIMQAKGILGVPDDGVYQSQEWAAEGDCSACVPEGKTLTVALTELSTVKVVARNIGQTMTVGGNAVTSVVADEALEAYGDTSVILGPGWWDMLTIVSGVYTGPPFTGSTEAADGIYYNWLGVPNMSASEASNGNGNWRGGDFMEVDAAMMSLSNYPYFDGSFPATNRYEYFWLGTPHESGSYREDLGEPDRTITDPDCPPVPAPPRPPVIETSCIEEIEDWRRYWIQINASEVPAWRTTLPTLEITPVFEDVRQLRVRYYPDPEGLGWDAMDPNAYCAEGIASYIPLGGTMIVDGITGRIWIEQDGELLPADHLVYGTGGGPHVLPLLDGGIPYLVSADVPDDSPVGNIEFNAFLTWRM